MPVGGVDRQFVALDADRVTGTVDVDDAGLVQLGLTSGVEIVRRAGRDQGHVPRVAAQEQRLAHAVVAGADHADALVGYLIAVADRAVAKQSALERLVVLASGPFRAGCCATPVASRTRASRDRIGAVLGLDQKFVPLWLDPRNGRVHALDPELVRLLAHQPEQFLARDAAGIARVIVRPRDQRGTCVAAVVQPDLQVEPREIDRRRQPSRSAADDHAVVHDRASVSWT